MPGLDKDDFLALINVLPFYYLGFCDRGFPCGKVHQGGEGERKKASDSMLLSTE